MRQQRQVTRNGIARQAVLLIVAVLGVSAVVGCAGSGVQGEATISQREMFERIEAGKAPLILDVRSDEEFSEGHLRGAVHIPHKELQARVSELAAHKTDEIVVYCRSGVRAGMAEKVLREAGFTQVRDLDGHILLWQKNGYPLVQ